MSTQTDRSISAMHYPGIALQPFGWLKPLWMLYLGVCFGCASSCLAVTIEAKTDQIPVNKLMTNLLAKDVIRDGSSTNSGSASLTNLVLPEVEQLVRTLETKGTNISGVEHEFAFARQLRLENKIFDATQILLSLVKRTLPDNIQRQIILELAYVAQADHQPLKALRLLSHFLTKYPDDDLVPEVILRQGLIYRQIGANGLALNKLYSVLSRVLNLKPDRLEYYQQLVLQAQTEIAETHYSQGQYAEAVDFLGRLLKMDNPTLNKGIIHYKLLRCLASSGQLGELVSMAERYLSAYPDSSEVPEVRFLLVRALKQLGRSQDALQQVRLLLEGQTEASRPRPDNWAYWQQRTGNEIANQLYKEGDFLNALLVYNQLAQLNTAPDWQLPVWYQIGLVYERLQQPQKASEIYTMIIGHQKGTNSVASSPSVQTVCDMAQWRKDFLAWHLQANKNTRDFTPLVEAKAPSLSSQ